MVKFIHMSDTHDDTAEKLRAVGKFAKENSIEKMFHSGDLIDAARVIQEITQILPKLPKPDKALAGRLRNRTATEEDKKKYMQMQTIHQQAILSPFIKRYKSIDEVLKENGVDTTFTTGNHDVSIAYDILGPERFAENGDVDFHGINVKGTFNTYENPYAGLSEIIKMPLLPYDLGKNIEKDESVKGVHDEELKRLRSGKKADLIIAHKELNDPSLGDAGIPTAAKKYLEENKGVPVLCGHFHGDSIDNYLDHPFIRAGPDTFYVIDMDENTKKINWVDVYRLIKIEDKEQKEAEKSIKSEPAYPVEEPYEPAEDLEDRLAPV